MRPKKTRPDSSRVVDGLPDWALPTLMPDWGAGNFGIAKDSAGQAIRCAWVKAAGQWRKTTLSFQSGQGGPPIFLRHAGELPAAAADSFQRLRRGGPRPVVGTLFAT